MHIAILTGGSRGDVQPYVALGEALMRAGHTVALATHRIYADLVCARGLGFTAVEGNPLEIVQGPEGRAWLASQRNPYAFARGYRDLIGANLRQATLDSLPVCEAADVLICSGVAFYAVYSLSELLNKPLVQAYLQPVYPSRYFPSPLFPTRLKGGALFNLFTHVAGGQTFWQLIRPILNEIRQEVLGLKPLPLMGPFIDIYRRRLPVLYGYSPAVLPPPADWGEYQQVVGFWFLDETAWEPPACLLDFLESGEPPVYIGFGSMSDQDPGRLTEISLSALKKAGARGILLTGWAELAQTDLPDEVLKLDEASHAWLFPRLAAVVHHAGVGTMAAGLRAGRPTVCVPFFGDQPFWAERVFDLGAGPRPIDRKDLTADILAQAIQLAAGDRDIRVAAAALGERIRAEDGLQAAVRLIEGWCHTWR